MIEAEEDEEEEVIPPVNEPYPFTMRPFPFSLIVKEPTPPLKAEIYPRHAID